MSNEIKVINGANATLGSSVNVGKGSERAAALTIALEIIKASAAAGIHLDTIHKKIRDDLKEMVDSIEAEIQKTSR